MPDRLSLFPKFLAHLAPPELAEACAAAGCSEAQVIVRDGHAVTPTTLATALPAYAAAMARAGLPLRHAVVGAEAAALAQRPELLRQLADHGIASVRMGYFRVAPGGDVRAALLQARRDLALLAPVAARAGLRAVLQVHHGALVSSPSAAWLVAQDADPAAIGIELDAGNQAREGHEDWDKAIGLLGAHLHSIGVKAVTPRSSDAGWTLDWCALAEGTTDWRTVVATVRRRGASILWDAQPFHQDRDRHAHLAAARADLAFLRTLLDRTAP